MARWKVWLRCLGEAAWHQVPRAIIGLLPLGERVIDAAVGFRDRLREAEQPPAERAAAVVELVTASAAEVEAEAQAISASVAQGQPAEVQQKLTQYLQLVPLFTQQALRRPEDPSGTTVPPQLVLDDARDLAALIPSVPPRFQPGDTPPSLHGWVLVKRLGTGGFGEVWQVRNLQANSVVAVVKFCLDDRAHRVLVQEKHVIDQVMSLGTLPTIVPLLDFDLDADPPYLKYQFSPGRDLLEVASHCCGVKATATIRNLAETVGRFHRLSPPVVHRDLKPSNILVEKERLPGGGSRGRLRVADFGMGGTALALDQDRVRTLPAALLGSHTARYASKQHKQGARPDPRDDVFALGVLWYQLLIGDLTSEGPAARWRRKIAALNLPDGLMDLLESCCDDDPSERPGDATEMAEKIVTAARLMAPPPAPGPATPRTVVPPAAPPRTEPVLSDVAEKRMRERAERHAEARQFEQRGLYAEAVAALEKLPPERREADFCASLVQRRDEVAALEKELHAAAHNAQLTPRHRTMALRWKELQPFRAEELDSLLALIPQLKPKVTNSLGIAFVLVPDGTFWMGGGGGKPGDRQVTIEQPFYLGIYPVTQAQWQAVMGNNPSHFDRTKSGGPDHPVEEVSWDDVQQFIENLNAQERGRGLLYRLPGEAEWEYACRGGATSQEECSYHFYLDGPSNSLSSTQANFRGNHPAGEAAEGPWLKRTSKVGSYQPNRLGICDMHGNVWEWCADAEGSARVIRGGSWYSHGSYCQAGLRLRFAPSYSFDYLGFRLAAVPSDI
jgi:formylglycine-generating enzyme required for sulfatase activity/tRNA A-37 threonylcarbamoyl transferase component Bud32